MHRRTFIFVIFLAIFAALVAGINLGKKLQTADVNPAPSPTRTLLSPTPTPTPFFVTYANTRCGFSLSYPSAFTKTENATAGALLIHNQTRETIILTCHDIIPRPQLPGEFIETRLLMNEAKTATTTAKLYHDTSTDQKEPVDALIWRNSTLGMDVFIAGYGAKFNEIIATLTLLNK